MMNIKMTELLGDYDPKPLNILSGNVSVEENISNTITLYMKYSGKYTKFELQFRNAYRIENNSSDDGIRDCTFQVNGRTFKDLSFTEGVKIREIEQDWQLRESTDGTKCLYCYEDIPTFDSGDRIWDSEKHIMIYADKDGVNMIKCNCGYRIPKIDVYVHLEKCDPEFSEWINELTND